jgi:hypothetical protein
VHSIARFTFDEKKNALKVATFANGGFDQESDFQYREDGRFHRGDLSFSFAVAKDGRNLFEQDLDIEGDVEVVGEASTRTKARIRPTFVIRLGSRSICRPAIILR